MNTEQLHEYKVWPSALRWFHWINFTCITGLIFMGLIMLNKSGLGISGNEAKISLKIVHVIIGYVFVINLLLRVILGFVGPANMRWSKVFPGKGYSDELKRFKVLEQDGRGNSWLGHNPKAKLALSLMYLMLFIMAITGLVRAATDIYYPPFGGLVSEYIAQEGVDPDSLIPYDKTHVDEVRYKAMNGFKGLWGTVHLYGAWTLLAFIFLHIFVVVRVENKHSGSLIASMFSGRKIFKGPPKV